MRCPFCGHNETQVKDSRPSEENAVIRRRRACTVCGARFTTQERIQLRELQVVKGNGEVEPFEREKLLRSISIATRKRNVSDERINLLVNSIVRRLESMGEHDILSKTIGEMVMEALSQLDKIAYIRFASVYRNFREASDFEDIIADVKEGEDDLDEKA